MVVRQLAHLQEVVHLPLFNTISGRTPSLLSRVQSQGEPPSFADFTGWIRRMCNNPKTAALHDAKQPSPYLHGKQDKSVFPQSDPSMTNMEGTR
eukprot:3938144-Rhodomonas_salina.1